MLEIDFPIENLIIDPLVLTVSRLPGVLPAAH